MSPRTAASASPAQHEDDPKARITRAALETIVEHGVHRTTHRRIAGHASMPLGSLTYHYANLDEILESAFRLLCDRMSEHYRRTLESAATRDQAVEAVVDLITSSDYASSADMKALIEMYSFSVCNPVVRGFCSSWLEKSRESLALHFEPPVARALDALIEGWPMQRAFDSDPVDRAVVRATVLAIAGSRELAAEK